MNEPYLPLAHLGGVVPPAPDWFDRAVAVEPEVGRIVVDSAAIETLAWGERGRPGLLLCHGGMAHARWWSHIAPLLAATHRVAALSWSGMGGSDWRDAYSVDGYVDEAWAAAEWAGLFDAGPPIFAGHSFGAAPVAVAAHARGQALKGAIVIDSGVSPPRPEAYMRMRTPGGRAYPSVEAALARFRFAPEQPCDNLFIADWIARHALRHEADGWRWCFDPGFFTKMGAWDSWSAIAEPACPLSFVFAERSGIVTRELLARQRARAAPGTPFIEVPASHHHIMVDQPLALVTAIRSIAAYWEN